MTNDDAQTILNSHHELNATAASLSHPRHVARRAVWKHGARLDRFCLFTATAGGQTVKIYLDLKYTASKP
ncbi:MAG: hypothetical protein U0987_08545 [Afipia sp.]|nr:hypothetical protein [Afipia sp.]